MSSPVRRGARHGFDLVELDSPANRNALSIALLTELLSAVRDSAAGSARGLVLTHSGPAFCAGVDLKERARLDRSDARHSELLAALLRELWHYPKPVVAMLDGVVRGGGLGLVACADIVLATRQSSFAYSEARVGVAPALVMAVTLPTGDGRRLLPHLLDARTFDADQAREIGLVSTVVSDQEAVDDTLEALRSGAPGALVTIKRLARQWSATDVDELLEEATALSAELFGAAEATEGMAAFAERRRPRWAADQEGEIPS